MLDQQGGQQLCREGGGGQGKAHTSEPASFLLTPCGQMILGSLPYPSHRSGIQPTPQGPWCPHLNHTTHWRPHEFPGPHTDHGDPHHQGGDKEDGGRSPAMSQAMEGVEEVSPGDTPQQDT